MVVRMCVFLTNSLILASLSATFEVFICFKSSLTISKASLTWGSINSVNITIKVQLNKI